MEILPPPNRAGTATAAPASSSGEMMPLNGQIISVKQYERQQRNAQAAADAAQAGQKFLEVTAYAFAFGFIFPAMLAVLFCFFDDSWHYFGDFWSWLLTGHHYKWVVAWAMFSYVFGCAAETTNVEEPAPAPQEAPRTPRKTGGVYGKAREAEDHEIDAALRGHAGGFEAMFEE